jgi:hypothetical protein
MMSRKESWSSCRLTREPLSSLTCTSRVWGEGEQYRALMQLTDARQQYRGCEVARLPYWQPAVSLCAIG